MHLRRTRAAFLALENVGQGWTFLGSSSVCTHLDNAISWSRRAVAQNEHKTRSELCPGSSHVIFVNDCWERALTTQKGSCSGRTGRSGSTVARSWGAPEAFADSPQRAGSAGPRPPGEQWARLDRPAS
jgi:hypothetical protein